ncbi:hypothetical protein [Halobellus rubicundus]|uniref:Uncharacterized protein n=1 Tax=Halobellus rubicundus TaxID=2996466 RepID=A0ABD5MDV3_9EURY
MSAGPEEIITDASDTAEPRAPTPLEAHETVGGKLLCIEPPRMRRDRPDEEHAWIQIDPTAFVDGQEVR